jgi:hypothetical protein
MVAGRWSDDDLSQALGRLLRSVDPVPDAVREAASASLAWLDLDVALAALVRDSDDRATTPAIRGETPRLLTFQVGDTAVDLEITPVANTVRLIGQLAPTRPATVRVCYADRGRHELTADALGRFARAGLPRGLARLHCVPHNNAQARFNTEWFMM